ncbi:MAG: class I adenylate cyclase [Gammaproteobacteria bacterium]
MQSSPPQSPIEVDVDRKALARFLAVNRERLRRAREMLTPRQRDFIDLLPLIFHLNDPALPGYVSSATPAGIRDFAPGTHEISVAQRMARAFTSKRRASFRHEIAGMYLMGSAGSIGYAQGSDFDIWLCPVPGVPEPRLAELAEKAARVERWAAEIGLDVHFFVFDAQGFREGRTLALSAESSGSTQHTLLLDEFYRSGLVLAGCNPLWWAVPPEREPDYGAFAGELIRRRFVGTGEFIDFGPVGAIPAEEFFGATVWQLYKGVTSPYKSVLKLLLMEVYAEEHPRIDLLSMRYKRALYDGCTDLARLDPYVQMYTKVEEYLMARADAARLDLLRRCFYIKVDDRLTRTRPDGGIPWRHELMQELTTRWGWDRSRLLLLDGREHWKLETVQSERRDLVSALTQSYRQISRFARERAETSRITGGDLTVLGRKLYAAFERKPGKIEFVNRGIESDLCEPRLALTETAADPPGQGWQLQRAAAVAGEAHDPAVLRRSRSAVEILLWCGLNGIADEHTPIATPGRDGELGAREARQILAQCDRLRACGAGADPTMQDLQHVPKLRHAMLFANVGVQPLRERLRANEHLTTNDADPLRYSGLRHNLAREFDLVLVSSWAEVFTHHYTGAAGLMACACEWLRWAMAAEAPEPPESLCFNSGFGQAIAGRLQALFADLLAWFRPGRRSRRRYVIEIEERAWVLDADDGAPRFAAPDSHAALLRELEQARPGYTRVRFDPGSLPDSPLPLLYDRHRRGTVLCGLHENAGGVDIYAVDEDGALFHQRVDAGDAGLAAEHFARLLAAVQRRIAGLNGSAGAAFTEFHRIERHGRAWRLVPMSAPMPGAEHYLDVQAVGDVDSSGATTYTLYCGEAEFSAVELGARVFDAAARYIYERRLSGMAYPFYITDIDLAPGLCAKLGIAAPRTIHYLQNKRAVEALLNKLINER